MTYQPSIPQPNDDMSDSQADLLGNFQQLNTQFGVNHVAFDDATNPGKHNMCTFVEQAADAPSAEGEHLIYSKDDSGDTELYGRAEANGTVFQMTKDGNIYTGLLPVVAVNFDSVNPNPNIYGNALNVNAGDILRTGIGTFKITFANPLPDSNYFWNVSGFGNGSVGKGVLSQVNNNNSYANVATDTFLTVRFATEDDVAVDPTRACVIIWRYQ